MGKKRHLEEDDAERDLPPVAVPSSLTASRQRRLIVILEEAQLEAVKIGRNFELLNSDDHAGFLRKNGRDIGSSRPDIAHQCLLMLMDSPLNRAGLLQVYIHTQKNVLIEINPQTRIPRTFRRFCNLFVQLLHKMSIRAEDGNMKLMKVIKNPVTDHLPVGIRKVGFSFSATSVVRPRELAPAEGPLAVVVGAMAHGKIRADYTEEFVSISSYPLSGALACSKLCDGFEESWGVQ